MANKNDLNNPLSTPSRPTRFKRPSFRVDPEAFGNFAEWIARYMGSPAFLVWMSLFLIVWIAWNIWMPNHLVFDENPFILLTLMLSIEAAYSAPLILLAQNRQEARDRMSMEEDRQVSQQSREDMDFLAREIASLRMSVGELATRDFVRSEIKNELTNELKQELRSELRKLLSQLEEEEDANERPSQ